MAAKPTIQQKKKSLKMQAGKLHGLGQGNWDKGDAEGQGGIGARVAK
jgi:hypothetical protein